MAKIDELEREASDLYKSGRNLDAALIFLQASDLALEFKNYAAWYKNRVWAAESFTGADEYIKCMNILLDVRLREPNDRPDLEAWIARKKLFEISMQSNPKLSKLKEILSELKEMSMQQSVQPADILSLEGWIAYQRGEFSQALKYYQTAWQEYDDNIGGYVKFGHAKSATHCCLRLNRLKETQDWLQATRRSCENFKICLYHVVKLEILYSLANPAQASDLEKKRRELEDITMMLQDRESKDTYNELATRLLLLLHPKLDPMNRNHPAWKLIIQRIADSKSVHSQFDYRLLLLDYRLASLRFSCGIPPVDDYYYTNSQQLQKGKLKINKKEANLRLKHALQSYKHAKEYGKKIDILLECDWRQREIEKRYQRIIEIKNHFNL